MFVRRGRGELNLNWQSRQVEALPCFHFIPLWFLFNWTFTFSSLSEWSDLGLKWVRFASNGTNSGLFKIRFQYILARWAKMYWNLIWKSPGFVPFGVNLTHFGPKSGHPILFRRMSIGFLWPFLSRGQYSLQMFAYNTCISRWRWYRNWVLNQCYIHCFREVSIIPSTFYIIIWNPLSVPMSVCMFAFIPNSIKHIEN